MFKKKTAKNTTSTTAETPVTTASTPKKKRSWKKILVTCLIIIFVGMPIVGNLISALGMGVMHLASNGDAPTYEIVAVVDEDSVMVADADGSAFEVHLYGICADIEILESYVGTSYELSFVGDSDDYVALLEDANGNILQLDMLRRGEASVTISGGYMHSDFLNAAMEYSE